MSDIPEVTGPCWHGDARSCRCEDRDVAFDMGRALAAQRPRTMITCEICGTEKEVWERKPDRQPARTCSGKCRQALWRRKKQTRDE